MTPESGLFPDTYVEPFMVAPEVEALAGVVLGEFNEFRPIGEAVIDFGLRIRFVFEMKAFDPLKEELKPHTIAKVTKASPVWRCLAETELVIQFRKAFWDAFSVDERRGVLHHELLHISIDALSPVVKVSINEHDVEEFSLTARRFGPRRRAHQLLYKAFLDWHHEQERPGPTPLRALDPSDLGDAIVDNASALQDTADELGSSITVKANGREATVTPRRGSRVDPEVLRDLLLLVLDEDVIPKGDDALLELVTSWSKETRGDVAAWASAVHLRASDHAVRIPPVPSVIAGLA